MAGKGVILFDGRATDPIRRVPDSGGVPTVAVKPDAAKQEVGTAWPFFLPDGRHYLFLSNNAKGPVTIKVASLDSSDVTVLVDLNRAWSIRRDTSSMSRSAR